MGTFLPAKVKIVMNMRAPLRLDTMDIPIDAISYPAPQCPFTCLLGSDLRLILLFRLPCLGGGESFREDSTLAIDKTVSFTKPCTVAFDLNYAICNDYSIKKETTASNSQLCCMRL